MQFDVLLNLQKKFMFLYLCLFILYLVMQKKKKNLISVLLRTNLWCRIAKNSNGQPESDDIDLNRLKRRIRSDGNQKKN